MYAPSFSYSLHTIADGFFFIFRLLVSNLFLSFIFRSVQFWLLHKSLSIYFCKSFSAFFILCGEGMKVNANKNRRKKMKMVWPSLSFALSFTYLQRRVLTFTDILRGKQNQRHIAYGKIRTQNGYRISQFSFFFFISFVRIFRSFILLYVLTCLANIKHLHRFWNLCFSIHFIFWDFVAWTMWQFFFSFLFLKRMKRKKNSKESK